MNLLQKLFGGGDSTKAIALRQPNAPAISNETAPVIHTDLTSDWFSGLKAIGRRIGVRGRLHYPDTDTDNLITWHRRNELAYSCIEKIAQTALDPELIVETRTNTKAEWERDDEHPFKRLFMRPSDSLDGSAFLTRWLVMLHVTGRFKARIYRNGIKLPARLVPVLPPARMIPVVSGIAGTPPLYYEYQDHVTREDVPVEDVFSDSFFDPSDEYGGLSPLAVALGAVDMDAAQTEYVRAFFNNGGVPSGVITVKNKTLQQEEADGILERWMRKYTRTSVVKSGPAVLDQNAEYQKIGANPDELASQHLNERAEARVCAPFQVPPLLAGALVGLKHQNNRASARAANADFWENKMSPLYKRIRIHLTWTIFKEFEGEDRIRAGLSRLNWDMSQVLALQEDGASKQKEARENLKAGGITLNQYLEKIGEKPLEGDSGKVYYIPSNLKVVRADELGAKVEPTPPPGGAPVKKRALPYAYKSIHSFSSTQVDLPELPAMMIAEMSLQIPDSCLAEDGREKNPHVTIKYGLHTSLASEVQEVIAGQPPVALKFGATTYFEGDGFDVVVVRVFSADLRRLNRLISNSLDHTDTHPQYVPHATVAYVKSGMGKEYAGDTFMEDVDVVCEEIVFTTKDEKVTRIKLTGVGQDVAVKR